MPKNKIIKFGLLAFLLVSAFLSTLLIDIKLPKIDLNEVPQIKKYYVLQPINSVDPIPSASITYPRVEKPLNFIDYFFQDINEKKDIRLRRYDYLFLASKRIAELDRWGNNLTLASWQSYLKQYEDAMQKSITGKRAKVVKSYILSHRQKLNEIISGLNKNAGDKTYLKKLSSSIFTRLNNKIDSFVLSYDARLFTYSLAEIENARDYGTYNASLDTSDIPSELINQVQTLNNNLFSYNFVIDAAKKNLLLQLPYKKQDRDLNISKEFDKKQKSYTYYLTLKSDGLKSGRYIIKLNYKFDISVTAKFERLLKNSSGTVKADEFVNEIFFHSPNNQEYQKIIEFNANKYYTTSRFVILSPLELESSNLQRFKFEFIPYYRPEIVIKKISQLPAGVAQVHYTKLQNNKYEIKLKNVNLYEAQYLQKFFGFGWKLKFFTKKTDIDSVYLSAYYWPPYVVKVIVLIILAIIIIKTIFKYIFSSISEIFVNFIQRVRYQLFLLVLIGIVFDIFSQPLSSDLYIILFSLLWIFTIVAFGTEARSTFVISLILLTLSPLYGIKKQDVIADKLVVWSFVFSLIGIFQSIFNHQTDNLEVKTFYNQTFSYLTSRMLYIIKIAIKLTIWLIHLVFKISSKSHLYFLLLKFFKNIITYLDKTIQFIEKYGIFATGATTYLSRKSIHVLILITNLTKKVFLLIFNLNPKTLKDWLFNILKALAIFIFFVLVFISINFFQNLLKVRQRYQLRLSLNPKISKFGPQIVYRSTKVIVYGRNFDWKPGDPALRLMTQYGEVEKELWTDIKIIFTIPLHWRNGKIFLWIEKPISWEDKLIVTKSEIVTLKLIPASSTFTPDDDAFFEQLKHLDKEILEINGYK